MIDLDELRRECVDQNNGDCFQKEIGKALDLLELQTCALLKIEWILDGPYLVCPACVSNIDTQEHNSTCTTDAVLTAAGYPTKESRAAKRSGPRCRGCRSLALRRAYHLSDHPGVFQCLACKEVVTV